MKLTRMSFPLVVLSAFSLLVAAWTMSSASTDMGQSMSQDWTNFLHHVNAGASDHAKLKDCITEGQ